VNGTKLTDPEVRKKLVEGGEATVAASTDSMIVLARKLDPIRASLPSGWRTASRAWSSARRAARQSPLRGVRKIYVPDATFTLRLSYGQVKGYPMNGTIAPPMTTLFGLYDRFGQLR
jgi:hypothetical protein